MRSLATLDAQGRYEGLPFMPEMIPFCGRRSTVWRRADKVCDTVGYSGGRRLRDGVILGELRCDGSAHDGCQAECRIFWKTVWLRRVSQDTPPAPAFLSEDIELLHTSTRPYARSENESASVPTYRSAKKHDNFAGVDLTPGEWVRVKSKEENRSHSHPGRKESRNVVRPEDAPPTAGRCTGCGSISRFIHERNGRMLTLCSAPVTLEGVVCSGDRSICRWFCPRQIYPYWREFWLERVDPPAKGSG